ncbi:MAG: hypothetical protein ABIG11_05370 [bacterium]
MRVAMLIERLRLFLSSFSGRILGFSAFPPASACKENNSCIKKSPQSVFFCTAAILSSLLIAVPPRIPAADPGFVPDASLGAAGYEAATSSGPDKLSDSQPAARMPLTDYIREKFSAPEIAEAFRHSDAARLEKTADGIRLKKDYRDSSQPQSALKPEEIKAIEALAARDRLKAGGMPEFLFAGSLSGGHAVRHNGKELRVRHVLKSGRQPAAVIENGAIVYPGAYADTNVIYIVSPGRCQEMLLLKSEKAPKEFKYEYSEEVSLNDKGEITVAGLTLSRPVIFDAAGRKVDGFYRKIGKKRVALAFDGTGLRYPLLIDPVWRAANSMSVARAYHAATLLICAGKEAMNEMVLRKNGIYGIFTLAEA